MNCSIQFKKIHGAAVPAALLEKLWHALMTFIHKQFLVSIATFKKVQSVIFAVINATGMQTGIWSPITWVRGYDAERPQTPDDLRIITEDAFQRITAMYL